MFSGTWGETGHGGSRDSLNIKISSPAARCPVLGFD